MKASMKLIIVIVSIIAVISIAVGVTYAYWSGAPTLDITDSDSTEVDNSENATTKYLVFAPIPTTGTYSDDYCFEYTDANGWVLKEEYGTDYVLEGGFHNAGSRNAASSSAITEVNGNISGVKVIGYIGTLGEFEDLIIPNTISWNGSTRSVTQIDLKMSEYNEPMQLITSVVIPASVTAINGVSFSGSNNLVNVYFNNVTKPATISQYAFVGMKSGITYYVKSGDDYVITSLR